MINYLLANTDEEYSVAKELFAEYAVAINVDLKFQQFNKELETLTEMYGPPHGGIILAKEAEDFVGCVAIRKISDTIGELKRMYVRPQHQNKGLGKALLSKAIELAQACKYKTIRLDTLNGMLSAISLYKQAGFYQIEPYYYNPISSAIYFEKEI